MKYSVDLAADFKKNELLFFAKANSLVFGKDRYLNVIGRFDASAVCYSTITHSKKNLFSFFGLL